MKAFTQLSQLYRGVEEEEEEVVVDLFIFNDTTGGE
jgi:hypothetical protein